MHVSDSNVTGDLRDKVPQPLLGEEETPRLRFRFPLPSDNSRVESRARGFVPQCPRDDTLTDGVISWLTDENDKENNHSRVSGGHR